MPPLSSHGKHTESENGPAMSVNHRSQMNRSAVAVIRRGLVKLGRSHAPNQ